ncbi:MAG: hypothetical protein AB7S36_23470, partial [Planctomycetota bacterium]
IEREFHKCVADLDRMQKNRNRRLKVFAEEHAADASINDYRLATPLNMKRMAALAMGEYLRAIHACMQPKAPPEKGPEEPAEAAIADDETNPIVPETPGNTDSQPDEEAAPVARPQAELVVA